MNRKSRKVGCILFFGLVFSFCTIQHVFAHKVTVFAWKEGDSVFTESRFSGGKRVKKGHIDVYDDSGKKIMEGMTDDQGLFSFKDPGGTGLDIVLKAGAGHQGHWEIPLESNEKKDTTTVEKTKKPEDIKASPKDLEAIVEKALDKKLKPVLAMIRAQQNSDPSLTDILGGIGYIIGLTGVAAWFSARKRKGRQDNG